MKETKKQLVDKVKKLQKHINDVNLPLDLATEIKKAAMSKCNGKKIDDVVDAFLVLALEAKMQQMKDVKDPAAIDSLSKLMKTKAALTFDAICSSLLINAMVGSTEEY